MRQYFECLGWLVQNGIVGQNGEKNLLINGALDPMLKDLEIDLIVQRNYIDYERLKSSGYKVEPQINSQEKFNNIIVFGDKHKELNLYYLSLAYELANSKIILITPNYLGGKSFAKYGLDLIGNGEKYSKNHCTIFVAKKGDSYNKKLLNSFRVLADDTILENGYHTTVGIFSHKDIDRGSKLLIDTINNLCGIGADLGAGWGYLSGEIIKKYLDIKYIDLYEVDFLAYYISKKNLFNKARFFWQSVVDIDLHNCYDFVVANPPFHSKDKQDIDLGIQFIKTAHKILKKDGKLWMVANRHLPYEVDLKKLFKKVELVGSSAEFKVFLATK